MTLPRPREIAALTSISVARAGDYLRGDRMPPASAVLEILQAFPLLDARGFLIEIVDRHARRAGKK